MAGSRYDRSPKAWLLQLSLGSVTVPIWGELLGQSGAAAPLEPRAHQLLPAILNRDRAPGALFLARLAVYNCEESGVKDYTDATANGT